MKVFYTDYKTELPKSAVVYCVGDTLIAIDLADDNNLILISNANNWSTTITNVVKAVLHFCETHDYITYTVYNLKTDDFIRRFFEVEDYKQFEGLRGEKTLSGLIRATEKNKEKAKVLIDRFEKIL